IVIGPLQAACLPVRHLVVVAAALQAFHVYRKVSRPDRHADGPRAFPGARVAAQLDAPLDAIVRNPGGHTVVQYVDHAAAGPAPVEKRRWPAQYFDPSG